MKLRAWAVACLLLAGGPLAAQDTTEPPAVDSTANQTKVTRFSDLQINAEAERPPLIPTADFASRSSLREVTISPDGSLLAANQVTNGRHELLVFDVGTLELAHSISLAENDRIEWIRWAGNNKLIFSTSGVRWILRGNQFRSSKMRFYDLDSASLFEMKLDGRPYSGFGELLHVAEDGSYALFSFRRTRRHKTPSVYRFDLEAESEGEKAVDRLRNVASWYADDAGIVRLGIGIRNSRLRIYYRETGDLPFELIDKFRADDERARYWDAIRIVSGSDQGYVLDENEQGRVGIRLFDYRNGEVVDTFFEHPDWDIKELWLDSNGDPLAAHYTDDRDQIVWFDAEMETLHTQLGEALQADEIRILSRSRDSRTMIVWARGESDPGALYLYNSEARNLQLLGNYRPQLDHRHLARPQAVRLQARDGLEISAYLTLPRGREAQGLPLIILPHGGPFGVRDKLEYNDEVQLLANRGYAVLQPNFRGSGGYGEAFYDAGRGEVGRKMQDDIDDAMDWAVGEGIANPDRVCVVGGSYGGFSALWAVIRNPERYACAASWAGVTDWDNMFRYDRRYLGREDARELRGDLVGEEEDLSEYSPINHVASLTKPILLAHGAQDRRVPIQQFEDFVEESARSAVQPITLRIENAGHSFANSDNEKEWFDALDAFLAQHNPADQLNEAGEWVPPNRAPRSVNFQPIDLPSQSGAQSN